MIDPRNEASQNVARKVGFTFWKEALIDRHLVHLYRLDLPMGPVDQS